MAKKIKFDDVQLMEQLFQQLSAEEAAEGSVCPFRDWEILHELDRQVRRREYDKSPVRLEQRYKRKEERSKIFGYLNKHPDVKQKLETKVREGIIPTGNN